MPSSAPQPHENLAPAPGEQVIHQRLPDAAPLPLRPNVRVADEIHIAAEEWHHFVYRDRVTSRMLDGASG